MDEFLTELRGKRGYKAFQEMRMNSPIISALLLANELSIRKVSWTFTSDTSTDDATDPRVELLDAARENMSLSWNDFITEVLTMLPFGFSLFEVVYERIGSQVLWHKFAPRGQDTIYKWNMNDSGALQSVTQQAAPKYQTIEIPIDKLLLFRTRVERGNPEGRSILRSAWVPYYYAKHIQQVEAIGIERDLAGLPVIKLPPGATTDGTNSDGARAEEIVRNIRNDEQSGIVLPNLWELELLSTGGSRQFDTDKIVRRYESRMLMSALAQFVMLGQDGVGSLALSKDATDFFVMAVNSVADIISETFTKYAIPRLLKLNGYDAEGVQLEHTPAGDVDAAALMTTIKAGIDAGLITIDAQDELWMRQLIDMPERDIEELQETRDTKEEMTNARNQAILEQARQGMQDGEKPSSDGEKPPKDNEYSVTHYAADPPDKAKRRKLERQLEQQIAKALEKTRRSVMKYARENKRA